MEACVPRFRIALILLFLATLTGLASGQSPEQLSSTDRAYIASKIYSLANMYFAHWSGVPDLDFEANYRRYLEQALNAKGRFDFDLSTIEFVESLHNSHTHFTDDWLTRNYGKPLGFRAKHVEGKWVVSTSTRPDLKVGDVITAIDHTPIDDFLNARLKYRFARKGLEGVNLFGAAYLFPMRFTVTLSGNRDVVVDRATSAPTPPRETTGRWIAENKIGYISIPSFGDAKFEKAAVDFVHQFKSAEAIIIDVRGNGGGSTPQQLIDATMTQPYHSYRVATPLQIGAVQSYRDLPKQFDLSMMSDYTRGEVAAFADYDNAQFLWGGGLRQPKAESFQGRLLILIDEQCISACEDFVIPFADNHRAILIGRTTWGSTGMPYIYNFKNGMMVTIGTQRVYLPNGSEFEGVGLKPDIEVPDTIADLTGGRDTVLDKAIELANISKK